MVRCGRASPSLRQNSQPISPWMYSASSFSASSTMRAASSTSTPTPSPGSQAILYFGELPPRAMFPSRDQLSPHSLTAWSAPAGCGHETYRLDSNGNYLGSRHVSGVPFVASWTVRSLWSQVRISWSFRCRPTSAARGSSRPARPPAPHRGLTACGSGVALDGDVVRAAGVLVDADAGVAEAAISYGVGGSGVAVRARNDVSGYQRTRTASGTSPSIQLSMSMACGLSGSSASVV